MSARLCACGEGPIVVYFGVARDGRYGLISQCHVPHVRRSEQKGERSCPRHRQALSRQTLVQQTLVRQTMVQQ